MSSQGVPVMKSSSKVLGPDYEILLRHPQWEALPDRDGSRVVPLRPRVAPVAGDLVTDARQRAEELIAEAEAVARAVQDEARRQGYAEGLATGRAEAEAAVADLHRRTQAEAAALQAEGAAVLAAARQEAAELRAAGAAAAAAQRQALEAERAEMLAAARTVGQQLVAAAEAEVRAFQEASRQALVDLALAVAGRVLQYELAVRPALVAALVAAGLERLRGEDATIRLNAADLPALAARRDELRRTAGFAALEFVADGALEQGEFLLRGRHGEVDGRRERVLEAMRQPLLRQLQEAE